MSSINLSNESPAPSHPASECSSPGCHSPRTTFLTLGDNHKEVDPVVLARLNETAERIQQEHATDTASIRLTAPTAVNAPDIPQQVLQT